MMQREDAPKARDGATGGVGGKRLRSLRAVLGPDLGTAQPLELCKTNTCGFSQATLWHFVIVA